MKFKLFALLLAAAMVVPAVADEKEQKKAKGKGKKGGFSPATQLLKQLGDVGLTEEQTAKIKELAKASQETIKKAQDEAGITAELLKKRREVMTKMKDSELKGKERVDAINKECGFSEEHSKAIAAANELRAKLKQQVIALLSDEQKAKLPKGMQGKRGGKAGAAKDGEKKAKGKKKEKAAA